jgi:hypothetical protein
MFKKKADSLVVLANMLALGEWGVLRPGNIGVVEGSE